MLEHEIPSILWAEEPSDWPKAPEWMSFYRLREAESCPRRAALKAAAYPGIWSHSGYPPKLRLSALFGQVVHSCVRTLSMRLAEAGCLSIRDPQAVDLLRAFGGYSEIIRNRINAVVADQSENPRGIAGRQSLLDMLCARIPEAREQLQVMLGRLELGGMRSVQTSQDDEIRKRTPLSQNPHFEVVLRAPSFGWVGVADCIDLSGNRCEIVDFKTGDLQEEHKCQLQIYALLWIRDREINPERRPADRLVLSYPNGLVDVAAPSESELKELEGDINNRTKAVRDALGIRPPEARPSQVNCSFCEVRHLCREYWAPETQLMLAAEKPTDTKYGDVQVRITAKQAAKSWKGIVASSQAFAPETQVIVRTPRFDNTLNDVLLRTSDQVRILDARLTHPTEAGAPPVVTMSEMSEGFLVR